MASRCNMSYPQNLRISLRLLTLFLTMTWHFPVTGASMTQLTGEFDGNVTFQCIVDPKKEVIFWYLQRGNIFIDGYHKSRNLTPAWNNTRVDLAKTSIHMDSLKVSHAGIYQCYIRYKDNKISENRIRLSITAPYSTPVVKVACSDETSCQATCASHGGYPKTQVVWNVPESSLSKDVNSSEMIDSETQLFSLSSTVFFNCTNGELTSLSCSVGDVTSEMFPVCTPKDPPEPNNIYVIAATVTALLIVAIIAVVLLIKCIHRPTGGDGSQEGGHEHELDPLK